MTTKHDVVVDSNWKNVNTSVSMPAGVPISIQNKTTHDILQWVGVAPQGSDINSGIILRGDDYSVRTLPLFPAEFLFIKVTDKSLDGKNATIGVYVD